MSGSLAIALLGGSDLDDATRGGGERGRVLHCGLAERLRQRHPDLAVEVRPVEARDVWSWADDLEELRRQVRGVDVALRSIQPDLASGRTGPALSAEFATAMAQVIAVCKEEGVRVIVLNGATYAPDDTVSCYRDEPDTIALSTHRLDLELIELSMLDGISVLDVDRIVGEHGGGAHVSASLTYSAHVNEAIRDELADLLEEYGFCDGRPVLVQRGRRGS
jgi:hypothetical protein